jgi:hypothetical protein
MSRQFSNLKDGKDLHSPPMANGRVKKALDLNNFHEWNAVIIKKSTVKITPAAVEGI